MGERLDALKSLKDKGSISESEFQAIEKHKKSSRGQHQLKHTQGGWLDAQGNRKRNVAVEKAILQAHYKKTPRTMLRYAIEKLPEQVRKKYLAGEI